MTKKEAPDNEFGKQVDLQQEFHADSQEQAMEVYIAARKKLLHPPVWQPMSGPSTAVFDVNSPKAGNGKRLEVGDYIRIDVHAPGNPAGDGHDWVKVEKLEENAIEGVDESLLLTVFVSENPADDGEAVAHFFAEGASSTFIIERTGTTVTAKYSGRNEKPNTDQQGIITKVRNVAVALAAMAGLSEKQWRAFLKGLLYH